MIAEIDVFSFRRNTGNDGADVVVIGEIVPDPAGAS